MSRHLCVLNSLGVAVLAGAFLGCGSSGIESEARGAFDRFQAALRDGDRESLRELLTAESFPALDEVLAAGSRDSTAMVIEAAHTRSRGRVDLELIDPAASGTRGVCVVVRDGGQWRIDLVGSAIASHGVTARAGFDVRSGADPAAVQDAVMRQNDGTR